MIKVVADKTIPNTIEEIMKNQNTPNEGSKKAKRGTVAEKVLADLCSKENKTKQEKELLISIFGKLPIKGHVISILNENKEYIYEGIKYTKDLLKADIKVTFEDNTYEYISSKCTNDRNVSAFETTNENFCKNITYKNMPTILDGYKENGFTREKFKKNCPELEKEWQNYINENKRNLLKYVVEGGHNSLKPSKIIIIDASLKYIYYSSIDEYIDFVIKHEPEGTYNSKMIITRSHHGNIQFKIKNVIRNRTMKKIIKNNDSKELNIKVIKLDE